MIENKIEDHTCCSKQSSAEPGVQKPVYEWFVYCPVVVEHHLLMKSHVMNLHIFPTQYNCNIAA
jgi:hypothetical protein